MEIRDILDSQGNIIGTLSLPEGTPEEVWTAKLAEYSAVQQSSEVPNILDTLNLNASGQVTTSSTTPATVNGMSVVPTAGTYLIFFNGNIYTDGASAKGQFGIYVNDVLLPETRRDISCALTLLGGLVSISLNAIGVGTNTGTQVELDGNDTVDIKFKSNNGGTIGFSERVMTLIRVK
jgi:hypothetical protein